MDLSIVIPLLNEEESIKSLCNEVFTTLSDQTIDYEVILIDDGSTDNSWLVIQEIVYDFDNFKGVRLKKNQGKSTALDIGFQFVIGNVVITMDADLQDDPNEIMDLYKMIIDENYDLVSGWKKNRLDPLSKTIPTKLYNLVTRRLSGIKLHDFNCGLKAYSINLIRDIKLSGEMHRYIPLLAKHAGYIKIGEKVVNHRRRTYGTTKYGGWNRFSNGLLDLISILFLNKFGKNPMHFFGLIGLFSFVIGFVIALYLTYMKLLFLQFNMTNRPLFYLGILCMIIGSQFFLSGFLGELIIRNKPIEKDTKINKKIGF